MFIGVLIFFSHLSFYYRAFRVAPVGMCPSIANECLQPFLLKPFAVCVTQPETTRVPIFPSACHRYNFPSNYFHQDYFLHSTLFFSLLFPYILLTSDWTLRLLILSVPSYATKHPSPEPFLAALDGVLYWSSVRSSNENLV